jgi:hypothetical protein
MGAAHSRKLKCLYLPAQSGKTRKVEELIQLQEAYGGGDYNIWISSNSKLLTHQTSARLQKTFCEDSEADEDDNMTADAAVNGRVFSWTSGNKKTNISKGDLVCEMLDGLNMVVCCANGVRLRYLAEVLRRLTSHSRFVTNKLIHIWIDEADSSIKLWQKYADILALGQVVQVTLISATFTEVFKHFDRLPILGFPETAPPCYRRLAHCIKNPIDIKSHTAEEYIAAVLDDEEYSHLLAPGQRAFIPGDFVKKSHEAIAAYLQTKGFAVMILNGTHKELRVPGKKAVDLRPYLTVDDPDDLPAEFKDTLAYIYKTQGLHKYPFAITGYLCVERGVTFQCGPNAEHDGFLFDYGIVPPISDKAGAYQCMARLFGNIGDLEAYKARGATNLYTTTGMIKKVTQMEEIAVNLARIAHEEGMHDVGEEELRRAAAYKKEKHWKVITGEFEEREEANAFLEENGCPKNNRAHKLDADGFVMSSTTGKLTRLSYADVMAALGMGKLSLFDIRMKADETPERPVHSRTFVCYKDIHDKSSITYVTRVVKYEPKKKLRPIWV